MSWVKAGESGVRRVFDERSRGVPARDERLWTMFQPVPKRGWSSAVGAPVKRGGPGSVSSTSGKALRLQGSLLSAGGVEG